MNYVENASWGRRNRGETDFHASAANSRLVGKPEIEIPKLVLCGAACDATKM
jgi:hypothetical protein